MAACFCLFIGVKYKPGSYIVAISAYSQMGFLSAWLMDRHSDEISK